MSTRDRLFSTSSRFELVMHDSGMVGRYDYDTGEEVEVVPGIGDIPPPIPPPTPIPPPGHLRELMVEADTFRESGPEYKRFNWTGATSFGLIHQVMSSQERSNGWLDFFAARRFNILRYVAGIQNSWLSLTPSDALNNLHRAITAASVRGLRSQVVAISDAAVLYGNRDDVRHHVMEVAEICNAHTSSVLEIANEPAHPVHGELLEPEFLRDLRMEVQDRHPRMLVSDGTSPEDEDTSAYTGDYIVRHLDRNRDPFNNVRRVKNLWYDVQAHLGAPVINNEMTGADEQDSYGDRISEPWFFFAQGALQALFGVGGNFHSQAGLMADFTLLGPHHTACADAFIEGMETRTPENHGRGSYKNVGHTGGPIVEAKFHELGQGDVIKAYSMVTGNRARTVVLHVGENLQDEDITVGGGWMIIQEKSKYPGVTLIESAF